MSNPTERVDSHLYPIVDVNQAFRGGPRTLKFLAQINKASLVMLVETGIVPADIAARIAAGILAIDDDQDAPQSGDYLQYEQRLVARIGPQASLVHAGRSRQDIASTLSRMNLRDDLLNAHHALASARAAVIELADGHRDTIIPAYTHGVQAQPTTLAHYLLALSGSIGRQLERFVEAWKRLNLSSLGAAALSTSSFPVDRNRLATLLGFDGLIENAYDANHFAPVDSALDYANALSVCAVQIGQFAQDIHAQYAAPVPWLTLQAGDLIGVSSLMPQKRNPAALEQLRAQCSLLLADMQGPFMLAHNVRTGMFDYRAYDPLPTTRPVAMLALFERVVRALIVNREQARAEVDADYSTVTEIADKLMQRANVPFRIGHHFASVLTDYGRAQRKRPCDIGYAEAARLYEQANDEPMPLDEAAFAQCVDPAQMVFSRRGRGGPQLDEVARMFADESRATAAALDWNRATRAHLAETHAELQQLTVALAH
ncbi:argininosuccinate lyase [Paraburkholderia sp. Ac-20336]|uniref:argininosuccinate lyase n=1 Tax=Paraburkholderia sp. Ac-20336 TaxID=2703886 RepID=UPI001980FDB4|nr:argininosuccinate lyase [Paraburkholderia sp. Ac-20336]MBN3801942.1 argininosuccinate lyase [Paraburkholderia sp. Ac-20336]